MKRRPGELLPLEEHLLLLGAKAVTQHTSTLLSAQGWFHPYGAAKALVEIYGDSLAKNGTLYRSLRGLADRGFLEDRLETEDEAATHTGPARRYFKITAEGQRAVEEATGRRTAAAKAWTGSKRKPAPAPSTI